MKRKFLLLPIFCLLTSCSTPTLRDDIYYEITFEKEIFKDIYSIHIRDVLVEDKDKEYVENQLNYIFDDSKIYFHYNGFDGLFPMSKTKYIIIKYNEFDDNPIFSPDETFNSFDFEIMDKPRTEETAIPVYSRFKDKEVSGYYIWTCGYYYNFKVVKNAWVREQTSIFYLLFKLKDLDHYNAFYTLANFYSVE